MATVTKRFGPADDGVELTLDEYEAADYKPGAKYELIDGRLAVSPQPNFPHDSLETWLLFTLHDYSRSRPDVTNYVTSSARVFIPGPRPSVPEPDLAAYLLPPVPRRQIRWQDQSPLLVGEVLSPDTPGKDLDRNVALYLRVAAVREYWIADGRDDPDRPTLTVHRRRGARWQKPITVRFGETYTTRLLPGFELLVDPYALGS